MSINLEIIPGAGLGPVKFGFDKEEVRKILGDPEEEVTYDDEDDENTLSWYYWEDGISAHFDEEDQSTLVYIEVDNPDATLWGEKIFDMSEEDIKKLFERKGFTDPEEEVFEWGERRITYESLWVDLFFEDGELNGLNWSVFFDEEECPVWPD